MFIQNTANLHKSNKGGRLSAANILITEESLGNAKVFNFFKAVLKLFTVSYGYTLEFY